MSGRKRLALVLAGGAARGAYEVGVVDYIVHEIASATGRAVRFDILCGTSVGALNACALAAFANDSRIGSRRLVDIWTRLDISTLLTLDTRGLLSMGVRLFGRARRTPARVAARESGILDATGLEHLIESSIPFSAIAQNLARGDFEALTVSTTHVASGKTVVFVQRRDGDIPPWSHDPTILPLAASITSRHALASSAIPILFPSVRIENAYHCDGGLRQNVPLSPARRLGADGLIVVNPRHMSDGALGGNPQTEEAFPGPFFLLGKTLNALLLDRIDTDLARLKSINRILGAGIHAYGPDFVPTLNREMGHEAGRGVRPIHALLIRATKDIGVMAAEFVKSPAFARVQGVTGRIMRHVAERGGDKNENDLLSYLLFDGAFAGQLIELGRADARAQHDDLCAFVETLASGADPPPLKDRWPEADC